MQPVSVGFILDLMCASRLSPSFCSKDCQRSAWTWEIAPHKKICKSIGELLQLHKMAGTGYHREAKFKKLAQDVGYTKERVADIDDILDMVGTRG